ncbi:MAG: hypothetical protein ABSC48_17740 [Terracidiphilus sp.]|jgi:hypothetical protein
MGKKSIGEMTSRQMLDAVDRALAEVSRRLASGELDGSGRYYTDEELAAGAATEGVNIDKIRSRFRKPHNEEDLTAIKG